MPQNNKRRHCPHSHAVPLPHPPRLPIQQHNLLRLFPSSVQVHLQSSTTTSLSSFSTLLTTLTRTFLLDPDFHPKQSKLLKAVEDHQETFTNLKRDLEEAHSEWLGMSLVSIAILCGIGSRRKAEKGEAYDDAVDCGADEEEFWMRTSRKVTEERGKGKGNEGGRSRSSERERERESEQEEKDATLEAAASMFGDLVDDLGPPMSALATACTTTLHRIKHAFEHPRSSSAPSPSAPPFSAHEFMRLADDIQCSLYQFDSTSNRAVVRLYRRSEMAERLNVDKDVFYEDNVGGAMPRGMFEEGRDETVLLLYFFIFTIQEFTHELILLVQAMARIYALEREENERKMVLRWLWGLFVAWRKGYVGIADYHEEEQEEVGMGGGLGREHDMDGGEDAGKKGLRRLSALLSTRPSFPTTGTTTSRTSFPKVKPHAPNTVQTPARSTLTFRGRLKQRLWALGARIKEPDMKYAMKTGLATAMLAASAFWEGTREFFVVISPVLEQTNMLSLHRVLGTILGALTAVITFRLSSENPAMLALCGFAYSVPCFYWILVQPAYATSVRLVVGLTYNLTRLFRTEARRELGKELSDFCFNIGWLYNHLVVNYSCLPESLLRIPQADSRFTTPKKTASNTFAKGRSPERTPLINEQATRTTPGILNNYSSMNDTVGVDGLPPILLGVGAQKRREEKEKEKKGIRGKSHGQQFNI
ncbi:hypothetical protein M422DRAFT_257704 [Sphaerobolus stellatus SS14]|uniref:Uncharacterized protein n=1 Tax=Sphaerobolus stellatus (strain SS14) TaxID=990650 RepID=A0A0C9VD67_SPHS4|nr:hypothetical protein M422DRAFT_257704 [Sphaerobolus stellatus SS14]